MEGGRGRVGELIRVGAASEMGNFEPFFSSRSSRIPNVILVFVLLS